MEGSIPSLRPKEKIYIKSKKAMFIWSDNIKGKTIRFYSDGVRTLYISDNKGKHMNLFDILSMDERVIVYSHLGDRQIYTWNKSATLQCWQDMGKGEWEEIDIQTLSEKPTSYEKARQAAIMWDNGGM